MNIFLVLSASLLAGLALLVRSERKRAAAILADGRLRTLEDALFAFPDACRKCGFRTVAETEEATYIASDAWYEASGTSYEFTEWTKRSRLTIRS